jgi:hypothetical protein
MRYVACVHSGRSTPWPNVQRTSCFIDITQFSSVCPARMCVLYYYPNFRIEHFLCHCDTESQKALWCSCVLEDATVASLQEEG